MPVLTVFLTNRECPWRCVFCDLWRFALEHEVAPGDLPFQLESALAEAAAAGPPARQLKLYNAGSFFDARAIPPADHPALARLAGGFERLIVECHPALVGERVARFRDELVRASADPAPAFEVAMGLETVNPSVLPLLNKRVTTEDFARAAGWLRSEGIDVRGFVLVQPPYEASGEAVMWARRSAEFAFACGVSVVSLIPVRPGNGALEALRAAGQFEPPTLRTLEEAIETCLGSAPAGGRVFADVWDLERFSQCPACFPARRERLERMNHTQRVEPAVRCGCDDSRQGH